MSADDRRVEKKRNTLQAMATGFVMIPAQLLCEVAAGTITSSAFVLYCYLLFREGRKGKYWGSIQDICWGTGLSEAQVSRLLKQLIERGHIAREKRVGTTWNTYCLTRVDGRKILFRGKSGFYDTALDREITMKAIASNDKDGSSNDQINEAIHLFKECVPDDKDARGDEARLEREIDELFQDRQPRHSRKSKYF